MSSRLRLNFAEAGATRAAFALDFRLRKNSFVPRWLACLRPELTLGTPIKKGGVYYGPGIHSFERLRASLNENIAIVNRHLPGAIVGEAESNLDLQYLIDLHKDFERLSLCPEFSPRTGAPEAIEALVDINEHIHQLETVCAARASGRAPSPYFGLDVNFLGNHKFDLTEDDLDLFTPHLEYGGLYLNYATVGVPVLPAFLNGEKLPPVPQRRYRPDFTVSFNPSRRFTRFEELAYWLEGAFGWDIREPSLAIGLLPLGSLDRTGWADEHAIFEAVKGCPRIDSIQIVEG